jgi:hypothetical protein
LRIDLHGSIMPLVEGLPSLGDHHTDGPVIGPDGFLYFGQGTATNSVVGEDNAKEEVVAVQASNSMPMAFSSEFANNIVYGAEDVTSGIMSLCD